VPNRFNGWNTYIRFVEFKDIVQDREYNAV
jgi:hypothetical protein